MSFRTISLTFNLKNHPMEDVKILVMYSFYYGHGMGSDDPSECDIVRAIEEVNGNELTDSQIEEIRPTVEDLVASEMLQDRAERIQAQHEIRMEGER